MSTLLARAAALNVSRVCASALAEELDRRSKIAALDSYLHELDVKLGPVSAADQPAACDWADQKSGEAAQPTSVDVARTA